MHIRQIVCLLLTLLIATACVIEAPAPVDDTIPELTAAPMEEAVTDTTPASERVTNAIELTTNPWLWISFGDPLEQFDVETPENYTVAFNADGTVNIKADCNNASGSYTADDDGSLSIEIGPMTRVACPPESRSDEFVQKLGFVANFFFEDGFLYLNMMADGGTFQLAAASEHMPTAATEEESASERITNAIELTTNPWLWVSFSDPVEQFDVETPENYTVAFNSDGTVNIKADCNNAGGSYTADDSGTLAIEIGPMTMAACPPDSRSDEFVQKLGFVANFFFENGFLYLDMMADGGTFQLASASEHMPVSMAPTTGTLGSDALKNATYSGIYDEGPVSLTDGLYEGEPFVEDGAARPRVEYIDGGVRFGDLNGDDVADAAVVLVESSGGSGVFTYVAAQLNQDDQPVDAGAVLVGDRTQIQSMAITDGQIVLDIITQGLDDAQCCPSLKVRKSYAIQDSQLIEVGSEELGAVSVDDLNGTTWTLVELAGETPAAGEEPITLSFQDGEISGFGGCNRYNSTLTLAEENPQAMRIGPVAGTRMACPEPLLTQETTYFSALEHVSQWSYQVGQLSLFYVNDDGSTGTLLFAAQTMTEAASTTAEVTPASERITLAIELTTNPWLWVSFSDPVEQFDIEMPENYTVAFNTDGTVNIKADCNNASGSYSADDNGSLSIEMGPMTMAACPPESRSDDFVQKLGFVANFFFEDGFLYLDMMADGGTFQLAAASEHMPSADAETESSEAESASVLDTLLAQAAVFAPECPERSYPLPDPEQSVKRPLDFSPFEEALASFTAEQSAAVDSAIRGKTVLEIQELLGSGELTSEELVLYYVDRIGRYDENLLNSIMELNPDALTEAQARDAARGADHGPLFGIPVTLKDNIATTGPMHTTAGNYALIDWQADRDAFLVQQLRDAGAIILGKNNLSEWANYTDPCTPSGFSSLGGQTRNPFGPYDTLGSSSGSAVAVSADLTTVSIGSETAGSLVQPGRANGIVALRPSKGLVSGDNIIPLEPTLDTAGPMGRSVTDVAVLLTTLAATDPDEPRGADAAALADVDFTDHLSVEEVRTIRVGVVRFDTYATAFIPTFPDATPEEQEPMLDYIAQIPGTASFNGATTPVIEALESQGIEVVRINQSELPQDAPNSFTGFISYGFADALNRFLGELDPPAPVTSIEGVVEIINEDAAARAPYGQRHVENAASTDITADQYAEAVSEAQARAEAWLTAVYEQYEIDVLMVGSFYTIGGSAGVPAINIPIGRKANPDTGELDEPAGVYITGSYLSDAKLIAVGYALEQALGDRVEPDLDVTVEQIEAVTGR